MKIIEKQLSEWRNSRNIKTFPLTIKEDLLSELKEVLQAKQNLDWNNYVEELADISIFAFNGIGLLNISYKKRGFSVESTLNQLDSYINSIATNNGIQVYTILCTIISMCEELVLKERYDFRKVVLEKIKVISSRQQNKDQKKHWELHGASGKWEKMKDQPKDTLYVGNYGKCKI